jgi:hypothetical protein
MTAQRAALQVAGKAGTFSMEKPSDPLQLAKLARAAYQFGAWRSVPKQGGAFEKYRYLLRSKCPEALLLPELALRALVQSGAGCGWCALTVQAALHGLDGLDGQAAGRQELEPDPVLLELLGQPCPPCAARHADRAARRKAEAQAEAGVAARAAISMIERQDGRLAGKVARWSLERGWSKEMTRRALAAAARPRRLPGHLPTYPSRSPPRSGPPAPAAGPSRAGAGAQLLPEAAGAVTEDLTGRKVGELAVLGRAALGGEVKGIPTTGWWHCRCSCGALVVTHGDALRYGRITRCSQHPVPAGWQP